MEVFRIKRAHPHQTDRGPLKQRRGPTGSSSPLLSASDLLEADLTSVGELPSSTLSLKTAVCPSSRRLESQPPPPPKCKNTPPPLHPRLTPAGCGYTHSGWCCPRWLFEVSAVRRSCTRPFHSPVGKSLSSVSTFKDNLCDCRVIN